MEGRFRIFPAFLVLIFLLSSVNAMYFLESVYCPTEGLPTWKVPTKKTPLKDICNFIVSVGTPMIAGPNTSSVTNDNNNYEIAIYLSLLDDVTNPRSNATKLGTIPIESSQFESKYSVQVTLDNISVPPVEFCGDVFLVADLQETKESKTESTSCMSSKIQVACLNEEDVDLMLMVQSANGSAIEFTDYDNFWSNAYSFPLYELDKPITNQIPGGLKIMVKNNGRSLFRQRTCMKTLQVWAFLRAYNNDKMLTLGVEQDDIKSLQYSIGDIILHKGNRLVNTFGDILTDAIPPGETVELDMTQLVLFSDQKPHPSYQSYLIIALDPLNSLMEANRKNNYFVLPMIVKCCNQYDPYCEVKWDFWKGGNTAWITYKPSYTTDVTIYEYLREDKSVKKVRKSDVMKDMNQLIWLERVTEVLADIMEQQGQCEIDIMANEEPLLLRIGNLALQLKQAFMSSMKDDMSEWQQSQLKMMSILASGINRIIEEVVLPEGSLHKYLYEIINMHQPRGRMNHYGKPDGMMSNNYEPKNSWSSMSYHTTTQSSYSDNFTRMYSTEKASSTQPSPDDEYSPFEMIRNGLKAMIYTSTPIPYLPKGLRNIIQRLMLGSVEEARGLNPALPYDFLMEVKKAIEILLSENGPDSELLMPIGHTLQPNDLDISSEGEMKVIYKIKDLLATVQKDLKNATAGSREEEMLEIWEATLENSLASNFWYDWYQVAKEHRKITIMNDSWMLIEGKIGEFPEDKKCHMIALEKLMELKGFYESPLKMIKKTFYKAENNAVLRGDRDPVTGKLFWTKIMLCSCSDYYRCNKYHSYNPSNTYYSSSYYSHSYPSSNTYYSSSYYSHSYPPYK
ncbi:uncharacterized protein LOC106461724 [Limulus polyphemus]|uniref:Uncharacterized protein LOC106461724 n=1 Tax=Limulus polyphemus TaxID=6850 RepID=A0ABM1SLF4_LIMPO|nr:uncharacterized protein LOC106461724 [Limulus polyphemus]